MVYCSSCGYELKGAKKFCSNCGYRIGEDELDQIRKEQSKSKETSKDNSGLTKFKEVEVIGEDSDNIEEMKTAEIVEKPVIERQQVPPGAKVKEKIPKSTRCSVCGSKTDEMCFFCEWAVCDEHNIQMQIVTDTGTFGNVILSCPDCADRKNGKEPTQEEAADVGFFFKIKPYHEWKILH